MRAFVALTFALLGALNQRLPSDVPTLTAPTRQAPAMTEDERAALNAGIALLNEKKYDQAIEKYRTVLAANADSAGAMYEIALALTQKGDYAQAIEMAMKSATYDTVDLAKCLALIGTAFDLGGEPRKAIEVYERAIAIVPLAGTLHYNKAVAELQGLREPSLALASLKRGAIADPAHATTQQMLGRCGPTTRRTSSRCASATSSSRSCITCRGASACLARRTGSPPTPTASTRSWRGTRPTPGADPGRPRAGGRLAVSCTTPPPNAVNT